MTIDLGHSTPEPEGHDVLASATKRPVAQRPYRPFQAFGETVLRQSPLRDAVTAGYRRPEPDIVPALIGGAKLEPGLERAALATAERLVNALRAKPRRGGVEGLVQEYSLSSHEGVALMCLAEALLRVPDSATRDALIRDKLSSGDWHSHIGHSPSLFVNAATWGLVVTGKLTGSVNETGLATALQRLIAKGGEPLIRKGVDMAMRMMGEQFVTGQTIAEAIQHARTWESRGFRYSYDMLGEAATTMADADRYYADYEVAIQAIGRAAQGRGVVGGPGISVKLSALHPRYSRAQRGRVMSELLPRLKALAVLARSHDIGLNIDAEEADRLDISLDLLEALCFAPDLGGWNGIGFVVQAYGKRAPAVIDVLIDLAQRSGHRLMVRLVKGAYWDSEIKRAQVDGLDGYPVYTRKLYTDLAYMVCARKMLAAPNAIFPQFATHNARTLAAIHALAGPWHPAQYEFQCLHGMGEPLYEEVVGPQKLDRPCRIYAPVGTHETLLAYLVRRLLENGANSSFVNRIADPAVGVDELIADPAELAESIDPLGAPHPAIPLPRDLFGASRQNSAGLDLSDERRLAELAASLASGMDPDFATDGSHDRESEIRNPADRSDVVGSIVAATPDKIDDALLEAHAAAPTWAAVPPAERARMLRGAADLMEARLHGLMGTIIREAGKSLPNAVGEVREAVDFLRYYADEAETLGAVRPLGPVVCISPWNFPLAIFTGQVAAALAAGNPVLAKPAEETPLIARLAVDLLREAGVPAGVLHLMLGDGEVGARLVADPRVGGVLFTGSTEVARIIQRQLATRLDPEGRPPVFVAETGGQNALVVDSSSLPEQVVGDVLASAFDSAGQRCSALRVLCVQDDVADKIVGMLKAAMAELVVGNPDRLSTDVGPVISVGAQAIITDHIEAMRRRGCRITQAPLPSDAGRGTFVAPTLIEIGALSDLEREVFGPVLHVMRFRRDRLDVLLDAINASGYGLTFGLHTRIDETVSRVTERIEAGNIYVNRNIIGASVGVQPFGGNGLSGTGPKAGGPLYLRRLVRDAPPRGSQPGRTPSLPAVALRDWLSKQGHDAAAARAASMIERSMLHQEREMPGPVGERNLYGLKPRGTILIHTQSARGLFAALAATLATGNRACVTGPAALHTTLASLPKVVTDHVVAASGDWIAEPVRAVLFEGSRSDLLALLGRLAERPGPVVPVHAVSPEGLAEGREDFPTDWLVEEKTVSINTAAAGGNATLMAIG